MIVVNPAVLNLLITNIVNAAHGCTDTAGDRVQLGTMGEQQLRTAATTALAIATGQVVYPSDLGPIKVKQARPPAGAIDIITG